MTRIIASVIVLFGLVAANPAHAIRASELVKRCNIFEPLYNEKTSLLENPNTPCMAYLFGAIDTYFIFRKTRGIPVCYPSPSIPMTTAAETVWAYFREHPDQWGRDAARLADHALSLAYPC